MVFGLEWIRSFGFGLALKRCGLSGLAWVQDFGSGLVLGLVRSVRPVSRGGGQSVVALRSGPES